MNEVEHTSPCTAQGARPAATAQELGRLFASVYEMVKEADEQQAVEIFIAAMKAVVARHELQEGTKECLHPSPKAATSCVIGG